MYVDLQITGDFYVTMWLCATMYPFRAKMAIDSFFDLHAIIYKPLFIHRFTNIHVAMERPVKHFSVDLSSNISTRRHLVW